MSDHDHDSSNRGGGAGRSSSTHTTAWVTCAVAVPLLYFLSIGPMVALDTRLSFGSGAHLWLDKVYAPLIWIAERNDAFAQVLNVYVRWFSGGQGPCG